MNCIIVDDNKIARATLMHLCEQMPGINVIASCTDALEAYKIIGEKEIDLMLLDIQMPHVTGLELVKNLGTKKPLIIFITSKKEFAIDAFELSVVDYIVKPVTAARFIKAIEKAKEVQQAANIKVDNDNSEYLFVRDGNVVKKIRISDILFAEAMGDYVKLYTAATGGRYYMVHNTLKTIEERLPKEKFLKVHRSYIVAIDKIDTLKDGCIIIGDASVPVADSYRSTLNSRLKIL